VGGRDVPDDVRIVTYVSRGFESMRGFDVFMKTAKRLCDRRSDVIFVVAGEDRCCYGSDEKRTGTKSFKEWVLSQDDYDLERFVFTGLVPPGELARLLAIADLHVYLTVPFVLSWSVMNALACGATVLASDTAPVREMIEHEKNGLLADFFDVDGFVEAAGRVLDDPAAFAHLGRAGVEMIRERYGLDVCLPKMLELYEAAADGRAGP
jgi:glycosyltransferase involved in cell wall biosynthesis